MKKTILIMFIIALAIITSTISAQSPDLKMKILDENPINGKTKIVCFQTTSGTISRDSVLLDNRKIIHYEPLVVSIDTSLDTITISSKFIEYQSQIMDAYSYPGKLSFLIDDSEKIFKSYFGFRVVEIIRKDTIKFLYSNALKEIEVSPVKEITINKHLNYWLSGAWVIFLVGFFFSFFNFKKIELFFNELESEEKKEKEEVLKFPYFIKGLVFVLWLVSLFWIVFSRSRFVLLLFVIIIIVVSLIKKHRLAKQRNKKKYENEILKQLKGLKNKNLQDVLSDQVLKAELKAMYLVELHAFEKGKNIDPYNEGHTCTEVIIEVQHDTDIGLKYLSSFVKVAISIDKGWDELKGFDLDKPIPL